MKFNLVFILFFLFAHFGVFSQDLIVTPQSATNLINNILLGNGMSATNIVSQGSNTQIGSFSGGFSMSPGAPFPFDQGIILTSGSIYDVPGVNSSNAISTSAEGLSDDDLQALLKNQSIPTRDAAVIEFDFIAKSDSIGFKYIFASDEYPEFACSDFNDVFAFFLSGPNPNGGNYFKKNIALIPKTNSSVSINTVNSGSAGSQGNDSHCDAIDLNWRNYSMYYNDNSNSINIQPDGYTSIFTAGAKVICGQKYHIKLALSDVGDDAFDSYVFLEAKSFKSTGVTFSSTIKDINGKILSNNYITEGCSEAILTFTANPPPKTDLTLNYTISGSATNNQDYTLPTTTVIPANQSAVNLKITPNPDNKNDDNESVIISIKDGCTNESTTITINIKDQLKIDATKISDPTCNGSNVNSDGIINFVTSGGTAPYTFSLNNGLTYPYNSSPISTLGNGNYTIKVKDKDGCIATDINTITMNKNCNCIPPIITTEFTNPTSCTSNDGTITIKGLTALTNYTISYSKDGIEIKPPITISTKQDETSYVIKDLSKGVYSKIYVSKNGCNSNEEIITLVNPLSPKLSVTANNPEKCGSKGELEFQFTNVPNGNYELNFDGGILNVSVVNNYAKLSNLNAGTYNNIKITNNGCTSENGINAKIDSLTPPTITSLNIVQPDCYTNKGSVKVNTTLNTDIQYSINGINYQTSNLFDELINGNYTITIKDSKNCFDTTKFTINKAPTPAKLVVTNPEKICEPNFINLFDNKYLIGSTNIGSVSFFKDSKKDSLVKNPENYTTLGVKTIFIETINSDGCKDTNHIITNITPIDSITIMSPPTKLCDNESIITLKTKEKNGIWSGLVIKQDGSIQPSELKLGQNEFTYKTNGFCPNSKTIIIELFKKPEISISKKDSICVGEQIVIKESSQNPNLVKYLWDFGDNSYSNELKETKHTYSSSGFYDVSLIATDINNCSDTITEKEFIYVIDKPIANFTFYPQKPTIYNNLVQTSNLSKYATSYQWYFGDGNESNLMNPSHLYKNTPSMYFINLKAINKKASCYHDTTIQIEIFEEFYYFIPNTFSPNGDELNNIFKPILSSSIAEENFSFYVYNRWGELLFESHDSKIGWDGTFGNTIVKNDTYIWKIEFKDKLQEKKYSETGHVNVLK